MSRSRRKTPIFPITCSKSEKIDKQMWHRRFRSLVRKCLLRDFDNAVFPHICEVGDIWGFAKDGKSYLKHAPKKALSK